MPKRVLVVSPHALLRTTRVALLERAGYSVQSLGSDEDAIALLDTDPFDLILIGLESVLSKKDIAQTLLDKYPDLLMVKIGIEAPGPIGYHSRVTDSAPQQVLATLREMLGKSAVNSLDT